MHVPITHVRWTKPTWLNTVVAHPNMLGQDLLIVLCSLQALQANIVPDNMSAKVFSTVFSSLETQFQVNFSSRYGTRPAEAC